jgi:hypothetical protein
MWEDETTQQFHLSCAHVAAGDNAGGVQEQTKSSDSHESRIMTLPVVVDDGSDSLSCSSSGDNALSLQTWGMSAKSLSSVCPNYHFTNLSVVMADDDNTDLNSEGDKSSVPSSSCLSKTISLSVYPTNNYGASSGSSTDFFIQSLQSHGSPSLSDDLTTRKCLGG